MFGGTWKRKEKVEGKADVEQTAQQDRKLKVIISSRLFWNIF